MTDLQYYLKRFEYLLPLLHSLPEAGPNPNITHAWHQTGLTGDFWEEGEVPKRPKPPLRPPKTPKFRLKTKTYVLEGYLDSDYGAPYWVFDLQVFHTRPLHNRKGLRGPYSYTKIDDILEEDLDKIPTFLANLSPKRTDTTAKKPQTHELS